MNYFIPKRLKNNYKMKFICTNCKREEIRKIISLANPPYQIHKDIDRIKDELNKQCKCGKGSYIVKDPN